MLQSDGRIWQQILEKNGNREEWELEHWDVGTADADKKRDVACGENRKEPAEGGTFCFYRAIRKCPVCLDRCLSFLVRHLV